MGRSGKRELSVDAHWIAPWPVGAVAAGFDLGLEASAVRHHEDRGHLVALLSVRRRHLDDAIAEVAVLAPTIDANRERARGDVRDARWRMDHHGRAAALPLTVLR